MEYEQTPNLNEENFDTRNNEPFQDITQEEPPVTSSGSKRVILLLSAVTLVIVLLTATYWFFQKKEPQSGSQISSNKQEENLVNEVDTNLTEDEDSSALNLPLLNLQKDVSLSDFDVLFKYETAESAGKFGLSLFTHFDGKLLYRVNYKKDERVTEYYLGTEHLFSTTDNVHAYNTDYEGELYILTSTLKDATKNLYDYNGKRTYTYEGSILDIERLENGELKITTGEREKKQPKVDIDADENYNVTISITNGINCSGESYKPSAYVFNPDIDPEGAFWTTFVCDGKEMNEDFVIVPQSLEAFHTPDPLLWVGSKKSDVDDYYARKMTIQNKMDEIMEKTEMFVAQFENGEISEDDLIEKIYALDAEYKPYETELQSLDTPQQYVLVDSQVSGGPYDGIREINLLDDKLFYTALTLEGWVAIYDEKQVSSPYDSALGTDARLDDGHLVFEMTDLKGKFDLNRMKRGGSVDSRDIIVDGQLVSQSNSKEHTVNSRNFLMVGDTPAYIVENRENSTSYLVYGESVIHLPEQEVREIYDIEGHLVINTGQSIYIEKN